LDEVRPEEPDDPYEEEEPMSELPRLDEPMLELPRWDEPDDECRPEEPEEPMSELLPARPEEPITPAEEPGMEDEPYELECMPELPRLDEPREEDWPIEELG